MFTGIVESVGKISRIDGNLFSIAHNFSEKFKIGDSIAISGMCATVLESSLENFTVEIMLESRRRTVFGNSKMGDSVNLERSAKIGDRNSGHFVTGHIDEVGKISKISRDGDAWKFRIGFSPENAALVVEKGSVAVDGTSMTVSAVSPKNSAECFFEICVISHTFSHTLFGKKNIGDSVNLEFDILGKYILRQNELREMKN
ncbi:riboflavin synthase [bacterium]|jgi:riboflavin synthase|nr:riboflavin synthase [bacterium]MBT6831472.1 riboflavin synthase [bacterium]MBT6996497.1 riboflavin synthase [bacterium]MBT7772705.1 riboflavin synthase [bacterium]